jgi:hypothetical protein
MEKRVVGIFSPYNASEKTLCALYLTNGIANRYRRAVWIVPEDVPLKSRYSGFSYKWDTERWIKAQRKQRANSRQEIPLSVLSLASEQERIKEKLKDCEVCIFLEESETLYSLLPKSAKTAVFIDPYQWQHKQSRDFVKKCTYSLSTSPWVTKKIVQPYIFTNNILCPFDPAIQLMPKIWTESGMTATIFYPAYNMSFTERRCLQQISDIVKTCCPATKSVIGYYDTKETSEPGRDARVYDWKLLDYIKQTDWIIDLSPRPLMGLFAAFAGSLGIQWSGFDIQPNKDEYSAARRHLLPYPKEGLTATKKIAEHIVRQLSTPFNDDTDRNKGMSSYINRIDEFTKAMNRIFGKKSQ